MNTPTTTSPADQHAKDEADTAVAVAQIKALGDQLGVARSTNDHGQMWENIRSARAALDVLEASVDKNHPQVAAAMRATQPAPFSKDPIPGQPLLSPPHDPNAPKDAGVVTSPSDGQPGHGKGQSQRPPTKA